MPKDPLLKLPVDLLRKYHRHEVIGLNHIPRKGGALVVANHSFATYDLLMLGAAIFDERNRLTHALAHDLVFKIPGLRGLFVDAGMVPAGMGTAVKLLREGRLLGVTPGGMREALRNSSSERYQIRWAHRKGFVRLAIQSGKPVILAACPRADEIFDVKTGPLTDLAYETLKMPLALFKGWGPLPRPVRLTHFVDKPRKPPPAPKSEAKLELLVDEWHAELTQRMEELLERR